jgi:hypothetical protein
MGCLSAARIGGESQLCKLVKTAKIWCPSSLACWLYGHENSQPVEIYAVSKIGTALAMNLPGCIDFNLENKMNVFMILLLVALFCGGFALLVPVLTLGALVAVGCGVFLIWLLPILIIMDSNQTTAGEKAAWILAIIFLSWFAWIFYALLAPIKPRERPRYYY